jgi:hypothetical protein
VRLHSRPGIGIRAKEGLPALPFGAFDDGNPSPHNNPDGSEFGPFYLSPAAEHWVKENVWADSSYIDWGARTIIDEDGQFVGCVPIEAPAD